MSGEWLIRQHDRDGRYTQERVTVKDSVNTASGTEPDTKFASSYLSFTYADGRELIFPWNNILRCEYRPHNEP